MAMTHDPQERYARWLEVGTRIAFVFATVALALYFTGLTPALIPPDEIARSLSMSPHTLRTHTQNILTKLGVHSKLEALVLAIRHGRVHTLDVTDDGVDTGPGTTTDRA
jgi:hypothetical protein